MNVVFVFFLMPETKGIPLEAMDRLFSREVPARRAHKHILGQLRMEEQEFRRASVGGDKEQVEQREVTMEKV